jgi:beta-lactamase regulating signal transducer with metallopeptidase domain
MQINAFLLFLIHATVCTGLLYLVFLAFFSRLTFHRLNRFLLLSIAVAGIIIPLLKLEMPVIRPFLQSGLFYIGSGDNYGPAGPSPTAAIPLGAAQGLNLPLLILGIYLCGAAFHAFFLFKGLLFLFRLIKGEGRRSGPCVVVHTALKTPPFSFFRYIVINPEYHSLSDAEISQIIKHEQVHVRQLHSLDIVFLEAVKVLLWFNPFVRLIKSRLVETHEFLADHCVDNPRRHGYFNLLFRFSLAVPKLELANNFAMPFIQKRIEISACCRSYPRFFFFWPFSAGRPAP